MCRFRSDYRWIDAYWLQHKVWCGPGQWLAQETWESMSLHGARGSVLGMPQMHSLNKTNHTSSCRVMLACRPHAPYIIYLHKCKRHSVTQMPSVFSGLICMSKTGGVPPIFYMHISYICIYKWHICIYPILVYGMRHSMTHLNTYNMWFALPWLHRMSKRAAVRPICSSVRVRKRQTRMVVQVSCIACCTVLQSHKHLNDPYAAA